MTILADNSFIFDNGICAKLMPLSGMVTFSAIIEKFGEQGEKTGWTYVLVPSSVAGKVMPGKRQSFRVKGKIDHHEIAMVALIPFGQGNFILPLNAEMRKHIKKSKGAAVSVSIEVDNNTFSLPAGFMECLEDEPAALDNFNKLPPSHKNYFIRWISSAKTEATKAKRIAHSVTGLACGKNFGEILRAIKKLKEDF